MRKRLRVIFIVDSAQSSYETLVETHPAMYKYSDAIWMENWSKKSMIAVATRIVKYVEFIIFRVKTSLFIMQSFRNGSAIGELEKTVQIYESLDSSLKCPRRYVGFINTFARIIDQKTSSVLEQQQRIQVQLLCSRTFSHTTYLFRLLQTGVSKLSEARELVARLQEEAGQQERLLAQKQMEAKAALQMITDTIQSAGVKRGEMQDLRSTISAENIRLTERYSTP